MMKSLAPAAAVGPSKPTISKNQNQKTEYASGGNRFFAWLSPKPARRHGHFNKHINESDNDDDSPSMPRQGQRQRRASFDETHQNSRGKSGDWRGRGNNMDTFSVNRMVGSGSNNSTVSRSRDTLEHSPVTRASHNSDHAGHEGGSISRPHSQPLLTVLLIRLNELLPEYCDHLSTATDALHSDGASKAVRVLEEGAKIDLTPISWTNEVSEIHAKAAPQSFSPTRATKGIVDGHTYTMAKHASLNGDYLSVPSSPSYIAFSPPIAHYPTPSNTEISTNHVENKSSMPKSAPSSPQYKKYLALKNKTMSFGKGIIAPLRSQQNPQSQMNAIAESEWERFVSPFLMLAGAEVLYGQMQHVVSPESEKRYKLVDKLGENNSVNENVSTQKQGNEGAHNLHQSSWHMFPNALNSLLDSFKHPIPTNTASVSSIGRTNTPSEKEKPYLVSFAMQPSSPTKDNVATGKSVEEGKENIFGVQPSIPITSSNNANKRGSRRLISMYRQIREDIIIVGEYLCDPVLGARVGRAGTIDQTDHGQTTLLGQYTRSDVVTQKFPLPLLQVEELNRSSVISLSTSMSPERNHSISTKTLTHPRNKHQTNNHATSVSMVGDSHDHSLNSDDAVDGNGFHLYVPPPTPEKLREIAAISLRQTLDALIAYIDARCILVRIHAELCCAPKGPANSPFSISPSACMSPSSRNSFSDDTDHGVSKKWMMLAMQCRSILDKAPSWKMTEESMTKSAMDRLLKETKVLELALISVYNLMECK